MNKEFLRLKSHHYILVFGNIFEQEYFLARIQSLSTSGILHHWETHELWKTDIPVQRTMEEMERQQNWTHSILILQKISHLFVLCGIGFMVSGLGYLLELAQAGQLRMIIFTMLRISSQIRNFKLGKHFSR